MNFWFSPLALHESVTKILDEAGWAREPMIYTNTKCNISLFIYDSPERIISAATSAGRIIQTSTVIDGYKELLHAADNTKQKLLAGWRLQRMGVNGLNSWLAESCVNKEIGNAAPITPLLASVILSMNEINPQLLDLYTALEHQAELVGSQPDINYQHRLRRSIAQADPLPQLTTALLKKDSSAYEPPQESEDCFSVQQRMQEEIEQLLLTQQRQQCNYDKQMQELAESNHQLALDVKRLEEEARSKNHQLHMAEAKAVTLSSELQQSREEAEELRKASDHISKSLQNQLKQITETAHQCDDARKEQIEKLESHSQELQAVQHKLKIDIAQLEEQLRSCEMELQIVHAESQNTLRQLHQGQEELEYYFLHSRACMQLLNAQSDQLKRAHGLLASYCTDNTIPAAEYETVAVEVLPALDIYRYSSSLQAQALLEAYAASVNRAQKVLKDIF
jgi:DNA repair exonuclease SbcCD ATPase subunit